MGNEADSKEGRSGRPWYLDAAVVLWPSFLAASVAFFLFFAVVDPQVLRDAGPRIFDNLDREMGYALGFFFFWAMTALASFLSLYMVRTDRPGQGGG